MHRFMKRISVFALVCVLVSAMACPAFAATTEDQEGLTGPTDLFVDICDELFSEDSEYRAIDNNGNDVTAQFLAEYDDAYAAGNYELIWNAVKDELDTITWRREMPTPRLVMNGSASDYFYVLDETTDHMPGKTFEMLYSVSGTYKYHDSNGQITECSDAVLNIKSFNAGALFSYTLFNISTNERIAANKLSVTFSATFSLTMSYGSLNVPGLTWWEEDFGPYTGSVTGYTI